LHIIWLESNSLFFHSSGWYNHFVVYAVCVFENKTIRMYSPPSITSNVGFGHWGVDVVVKVCGVVRRDATALKLCVVSQNLQKGEIKHEFLLNFNRKVSLSLPRSDVIKEYSVRSPVSSFKNCNFCSCFFFDLSNRVSRGSMRVSEKLLNKDEGEIFHQ